jgi:hypothetical protein
MAERIPMKMTKTSTTTKRWTAKTYCDSTMPAIEMPKMIRPKIWGQCYSKIKIEVFG